MCRKFSVHDQYVVLSCPKPDREPVRRLRIEDMEFFNEKSDIIKCLFIFDVIMPISLLNVGQPKYRYTFKKSSYLVSLFAFIFPILYMKPISSHKPAGSSFRQFAVISARFAYPSRCRFVLCTSNLRISNWATSFSLF